MLAGIIAVVNPNDASRVEAAILVTGALLAVTVVVSLMRKYRGNSPRA